MKKIVSFLSLLLIFALAGNAIFACGPFTVEPYFSPTKHADYPLAEYAKGKAGIVPATYGRVSLFVFYRALNDLPLTAAEQKQVVDAMEFRIGSHWANTDNQSENESSAETADATPDYLKQWKTARAKVLNTDAKISVDKQSPDDYSSYGNCLEDAFNVAAKTLESRISQYGINDNVKEWLKGQDAVFSNCGLKGTIPVELNADAPDWLKQDRQYQIAAADFYDSKYAEARTAFEQIARDKNSVWSRTASFVAARTYIRQASEIDDESPDYELTPTPPPRPLSANTNIDANSRLSANSNFGNYSGNMMNTASNTAPPKKEIRSIESKQKDKQLLLNNAETKLENILSDAAMREFHPSANRLLGLVKYRNHPADRKSELADVLTRKTENPNIKNDLIDYVRLLDKIDEAAHETGYENDRAAAEKQGDTSFEYRLKIRDVPAAERKKDLTDWLITYQAVDGFAHAFEEWKATGKTQWLVAALAKAEKNNSQTAGLLSEADKIQRGSPAFATARYHQIRLLLENGERAEARKKLDEVFANNLKEFSVSARNKFYSQRMIIAANLDEFLKFAQRRASLFVWSDDANEAGDSLTDDKDLIKWKDRTMFDEDSVAFFNEKMSLSVLRQAALNPQLPEHLKKFLVAAVWTRAVILDNKAIEREFAPPMSRYYGSSSATNSADREAATLTTILRNPVIQPYVPVGFGRENSAPTSIDSNRGNWWCGEDANRKNSEYMNSTHYDLYDFQYPSVYPNFLTAAQTAEGAREHRQILASGDSATFLTRRAIDFAVRNPNNPQTPEILHLAVRSTRYGCADDDTTRLSRQAFDILHKRYPRSEWTKKTPYWF